VFLAAARLGAIVNPLLPIFRARELRFILAQSGARVLIIPGVFRGFDYRPLIGGLRRELHDLEHVFVCRDTAAASFRSLSDLFGAETTSLPAGGPDPDTTLLLMYTSGTTAAPKGVLHTHNTLAAEVLSLERVHRLSAADRTLMPSPVTHISGVIHAILTPAILGTSAVLMDRWEPARALELIAAERITYMAGAPSFLQELLQHPRASSFDTSSLRLFSCGGAAVSADLIRAARARFPGCVAKRVYGSTEFPTISTTDAADALARGIETEGRAIPPCEIRIADENDRSLPAGATGEVQARGPECFMGYAEPALNADTFTADGWFRTGDLGVLDTDGYLRITGRLKDIIVRKGEKISAPELEELIGECPAVAEVAVIALPDPQTGERACAVVRLAEGASLTLADLSAYLTRRGLAKQKHPEQLEIVAALPRTESGKVHKAALRDEIRGSQ